MKIQQTEALQTLQLNYQEPRNKRFNDLVRERIKGIRKLEEKIDHGKPLFVTATKGFCDFNRYRKSNLIFDDIKKVK